MSTEPKTEGSSYSEGLPEDKDILEAGDKFLNEGVGLDVVESTLEGAESVGYGEVSERVIYDESDFIVYFFSGHDPENERGIEVEVFEGKVNDFVTEYERLEEIFG